MQSPLPLTNTDPKSAIAEFEQLLVSNSGEDPFESAIKLLSAKLVDEAETTSTQQSKFKIHPSPTQTLKVVESLYRKAIQRWPRINGNDAELGISPPHLVRAMRPLVGWRLLDSDLSYLDATLERLVSRGSKGELGQYFTPRDVIRLCVNILNPSSKDHIIDPACGSSGFLFEASRHAASHGDKAPVCLGIDYSAKAVKVAALLAAATPRAKISISRANSLDGREYSSEMPSEWKPFLSKDAGLNTPRARSWGPWNRLGCSLLFTNPPFAGDIDEADILDAYEAHGDNAARRVTSREHLFLQRAVRLLRPGGRLAIVLPQGLLANPSASYLRDWLFRNYRVFGVIGLHHFTFLPYTAVKTSVLFLTRPRDDEALPSSYKIFFAVSRNPGRDNRGRITGQSDYEAIAGTFSRFLTSQGFAWADAHREPVPDTVSSEVPLDEVVRADRLDAEHYEPSARKLMRALNTGGESRIANLVSPRVERFRRQQYSEIVYLDISSVDNKSGLAFPETMPANDAPSRASYLVESGDVLVSTVRPERNVVAIVTGDASAPRVASNGFCVLRAQSVRPEVLFTYCKTDAFKRLLSRHATASMYPTVSDKDVLSMPFPTPPKHVEDKISDLISSALKMMEQAYQQIDSAIGLMNEHVGNTSSRDDLVTTSGVKEERAQYRTKRKKSTKHRKRT